MACLISIAVPYLILSYGAVFLACPVQALIISRQVGFAVSLSPCFEVAKLWYGTETLNRRHGKHSWETPSADLRAKAYRGFDENAAILNFQYSIGAFLFHLHGCCVDKHGFIRMGFVSLTKSCRKICKISYDIVTNSWLTLEHSFRDLHS